MTRIEKTRPGRRFEKAVHQFVDALPGSKDVYFDHKVPDRDDGKPRQADVWIEAKLLGTWPVSILISCKDYKRSINIGDIEKFISEKNSLNASVGIMYSTSNYSNRALKKAKSNNINCCRLYENENADLPQAVLFWSYLLHSRFKLQLCEIIGFNEVRFWKDVFSMNSTDSDGQPHVVIHWISQEFAKREKEEIERWSKTEGLPGNWAVEHSLSEIEPERNLIRFRVYGIWKTFRAPIEGHLLNGSYCFSDNTFRGKFMGPAIDTHGPPFGPNWIEIEDPALQDNRIMAVLYGSKGMSKQLYDAFGEKEIRS